MTQLLFAICRRSGLVVIAAMTLVHLSGCAGLMAKDSARGATETPMVSSFYGRECQGWRTASGEVYNMNGLSAAHKTLPFGTILRVRNPRNDKTVVVIVNNRGPFIKGRQLDLSLGAAKELGMIKQGVATTLVSQIGWDERYEKYLKRGRPVGPAPEILTASVSAPSKPTPE